MTDAITIPLVYAALVVAGLLTFINRCLR